MAYLNSFPHFFLIVFTTALNIKINITMIEGTTDVVKAEILLSVSHHVANHF